MKSGVNDQGKTVRYYFNYSDRTETLKYPHAEGKELLSGQAVKQGEVRELIAGELRLLKKCNCMYEEDCLVRQSSFGALGSGLRS